MNAILECIKSRRSVRSYKPEQVKTEEVQAIVEAGLWAPSAVNQQSWHVTVVQNQEVLTKLSQGTRAHLKKSGNTRYAQLAENDNFSVFHHAPTAIIVSGKEDAILIQADGAALMQNMLLASESLGLGSCWVNMVIFMLASPDASAWLAELGIPQGYKPLYSMALGYPAGEKRQGPERKENTVNYIK